MQNIAVVKKFNAKRHYNTHVWRGMTNADDSFIKLVDSLDELGVEWTKFVSLGTN